MSQKHDTQFFFRCFNKLTKQELVELLNLANNLHFLFITLGYANNAHSCKISP